MRMNLLLGIKKKKDFEKKVQMMKHQGCRFRILKLLSFILKENVALFFFFF